MCKRERQSKREEEGIRGRERKAMVRGMDRDREGAEEVKEKSESLQTGWFENEKLSLEKQRGRGGVCVFL